jgi:hypothetical protein
MRLGAVLVFALSKRHRRRADGGCCDHERSHDRGVLRPRGGTSLDSARCDVRVLGEVRIKRAMRTRTTA